MGISNNIYPQELILETSYGNGKYAYFLDINILHNNKKVFKIYNKTDDSNFEVVNFPFFDSNQYSKITYLMFYSQIFRYARICSNWIFFFN